MTKTIVHFDASGKQVATSWLIPGAVEAAVYGLKGAEIDACIRFVRKGDAEALAALIGEREPVMTQEDAVNALASKMVVNIVGEPGGPTAGQVIGQAARFEVRDAA